MTFGEKVRMMRTERGWSRNALSKKINVSLKTIGNWELKNKQPRSIQTYQSLAEVFECDVRDLINDNDAFLLQAEEQYGSAGVKQARNIVEQLSGMFAGGALPEEDMEDMMMIMQDAYWRAKKKNRAKYTPKKYRDTK